MLGTVWLGGMRTRLSLVFRLPPARSSDAPICILRTIE